jgi:hypothetical protein
MSVAAHTAALCAAILPRFGAFAGDGVVFARALPAICPGATRLQGMRRAEELVVGRPKLSRRIAPQFEPTAVSHVRM